MLYICQYYPPCLIVKPSQRTVHTGSATPEFSGIRVLYWSVGMLTTATVAELATRDPAEEKRKKKKQLEWKEPWMGGSGTPPGQLQPVSAFWKSHGKRPWPSQRQELKGAILRSDQATPLLWIQSKHLKPHPWGKTSEDQLLSASEILVSQFLTCWNTAIMPPTPLPAHGGCRIRWDTMNKRLRKEKGLCYSSLIMTYNT